MATQEQDDWRHRVEIASKCPYGPMHGGCHYPDCPDDCEGRNPTMRLAPIADKVAATMRKRGEPDDDYLAEKIQEEVHWASGGELDWKATDIVVGMVLKRLRDDYEPPDPPGFEGGFAANH